MIAKVINFSFKIKFNIFDFTGSYSFIKLTLDRAKLVPFKGLYGVVCD